MGQVFFTEKVKQILFVVKKLNKAQINQSGTKTSVLFHEDYLKKYIPSYHWIESEIYIRYLTDVELKAAISWFIDVIAKSVFLDPVSYEELYKTNEKTIREYWLVKKTNTQNLDQLVISFGNIKFNSFMIFVQVNLENNFFF